MIVRSLLTAFALVTTAAPAVAQEQVRVEINVADLDLSSAADHDRFETRLKSAAREACRSGYQSPGARASEKRCIEEVIASANSRPN